MSVSPSLLTEPMRSAPERLIEVIQELSLARTLNEVMAIVRTAARRLTNADGATFVLRDGLCCFYADEDAIGPLWKGKRFPLSACISGWAMLNKQSVALEDIYADPRIPADAYRPTFVKSLVMVPIRAAAPIGAIGTYWSQVKPHRPEDVRLLQALADSTSIAMENVELIANLERRVAERTAELEVVNRELETFAYSVSHDLRAPLRQIEGFGKFLEEDSGEQLSPQARSDLKRIREATVNMEQLIEALLGLAKHSTAPVVAERIDLSLMAREVVEALQRAEPARNVEVHVHEGLTCLGDLELMRVVLTNLVGNAWKFTRRVSAARIEIGVRSSEGGAHFFVKDNGAGFDQVNAPNLFGPFQRFHHAKEFEGTGVGLATVARVIARHHGKIWAESTPGQGATFNFSLESTAERPAAIEARGPEAARGA